MTSEPSRRPTLSGAVSDPMTSAGVKIRTVWADALDPVVSLEGKMLENTLGWNGPSTRSYLINIRKGNYINSSIFHCRKPALALRGVLTQVRNAALESTCEYPV